MSADMLRQAASLMRDRAEAATPGPWVSDEPASAWRAHDGNVETRHPAFEDWDNRIAACLSNDDSQHIATFATPAVALAVADWLEESADHLEAGEENDNSLLGHLCPTAIEGLECSVLGQSLAVAHAYLNAPTKEIA